MARVKRTARILSDCFFLDALPDELAELARRGPQARGELKALIRAKLQNGTTWPADEIGRAALVMFLFNEPPSSFAGKFRHVWQSGSKLPSRLAMHRPIFQKR